MDVFGKQFVVNYYCLLHPTHLLQEFPSEEVQLTTDNDEFLLDLLQTGEGRLVMPQRHQNMRFLQTNLLLSVQLLHVHTSHLNHTQGFSVVTLSLETLQLQHEGRTVFTVPPQDAVEIS
jgi:hypothetical protein